MSTCATCGAENTADSRFCKSCGAQIVAAAATHETRKTVTVLFIDAVSSTALGEQMDPESMRAVMTRYFDAMRETIEGHGGAVEKFIGDAVMAIFGVPTLHEDDALRACRAAVEIRQRLTELEPQIRADRGVAIEWRMGINTGPVVAGDVAAGQRMVTGDAVNVAARLEAAAAPGEILMGAETHALVHDAVSAEPLAALSLKGKSEPVPAWRLDGAKEAPGRHARPHEAPLVGRRRPLQLLQGAFQEAVEERVCHLFTVLGVAGVGKSRLVEEFLAGLGDRASVASGRCLAYGSGITYWPVAEALRSGVGIAEAATAEQAAAALSTVLIGEPEAERIAAATGSLIGLNADPHDQEELFWAVRKTFEALARGRPLVLVLDDTHWGEPTFLDLVEHIADWTRDAPILLIVMARSELLEKRPAWGGGKRSATTVQLEPLSEVESEELVGSLLGQADLTGAFRARVSSAAEGNPLFVEELLAKLIDDGFLQRAGDGWVSRGDLRELAIPSSIQALLAARLDGLGAEERSVIESGAVEGKVFHRGAVTALAAETSRDGVRDRLASLVRTELVRPEQSAFIGEEAYRFRHLLIRDAAYGAIAKQTRAELHERFAAWLEHIAADRLIEYEEIIAYHLEQAYRYRAELGPPDAAASELAKRAGILLAQASRRAEARGDLAATVDLMDRAADLLPRDADRRLLLAQVAPKLLDAGDGPRAESLLQEVVAESEAAGDERAVAWARLGLLSVQSSTQSTEASDDARVAEKLRDRLMELGDVEGAQQAELVAAWGLFQVGRVGESGARAQAVLDAVPGSGSLDSQARFQRDVAAVYGPMPADEVIQLIEDEDARGTQLPGAGLGASRMRAIQGRFAEAQVMLADSSQRFAELGNRLGLSLCHDLVGSAALLAGDIGEAVRNLQLSYDEQIALGDRSYASTTAGFVAEAYLEAQELDEAWQYAGIARDTSASDDIASQAGGRRIQARVLSARGQHAEAEALAREAVAIMGRTDYLEMHGDALVHLGKVLHAGGKVDEALTAAGEAAEFYGRKGATFLVERTRKLVGEWVGELG
ncbi:MAG: AAA family ATPase [Chloroflexi bacterium]|nr:AAA family ATPase [Chloroflexota bacterium]